MAIWLENQSAFHIDTLYETDGAAETQALSYWSYKRRRWQRAKDEFAAKSSDEIDALSGATQNNSFDPAAYMLPSDQRYSLLLEIAAGEQSLIYSVEIDNTTPTRFQIMERLGVPEKVEDPKTPWQISYDISEVLDSLNMLDSVLVTIDRKGTKK